MAIILDKINRLIIVEVPQTEVTVQALINTIRDWEDELENMEVASVAKASGKEALGGGLAVGITLELLNNWQLKFEDRPGPDYVQCTIKDGNLVGGIAGNPIKESAYTQVKLILSAAGTVAELEEVASESSVQELLSRIGIPTSPTIANDLDKIYATTSAVGSKVEAVGLKTENLPADPAAQSQVQAHVTALVTRDKGLEAIYDSVATLKALVEQIKITPKASSKV